MNYPGASPRGISEQPQLTAMYLLIFLFSSLILNIPSYNFFCSILSYSIYIISACPNISFHNIVTLFSLLDDGDIFLLLLYSLLFLQFQMGSFLVFLVSKNVRDHCPILSL